jgi:glycosyltransferase involved in cell wall biosynthesis
VPESSTLTITTVITNYNRRNLVARAIDSAFMELPIHPVIVVDDASQDSSTDYIRKRYAGMIGNGQLKLISLGYNVGVTGAKNSGYEAATSGWVIFLDSDDTYLPNSGSAIQKTLATSSASPIVFFRCKDQTGRFVGSRQGEDFQLDLSTYVRYASFGEALTAINKKLVGSSPPYISALRGYEGLGCCRLIHALGPARMSAVVARFYDTSGADRLSISSGLIRRLPLIADGHCMLVREFGHFMPVHSRLSLLSKALTYYLIGFLYRMIKVIKL